MLLVYLFVVSVLIREVTEEVIVAGLPPLMCQAEVDVVPASLFLL